MTEKKNILVVSVFPNFALNLLRCLDPARFSCHVMGDGVMTEVRSSRFCAGYLPSNLEDFRHGDDRVVESMNDYCEKNHISVVVPSDIVTTLMMARLKPRITAARVFPVSSLDTLETLHNKWTYARFLQQNGLPTPRTALLVDAAGPLPPGVSFPVFVKPLDQGDGLGVRKLDTAADLDRYLAEGRYRPPLQLQEFIPGTDGSLNFLAVEGKILAWSMQRGVVGGVIRFFEDETLLEMGRVIARASNYSGAGNFNFRLDSRDGSYRLTECNPRFWGSLRASLWNGVNFLELGILAALGEELPPIVQKGITYMRPNNLLENLRRGRFSELRRVPPATWRDLGLMMTDPASSVRVVRKKLSKRSSS